MCRARQGANFTRSHTLYSKGDEEQVKYSEEGVESQGLKSTFPRMLGGVVGQNVLLFLKLPSDLYFF